MKLTDVYRLIVTVFVSMTLVTGCTNNAERKANHERKLLAAERSQVAKLQKEAEAKRLEIKGLEEDLKQKVEALTNDKNAWEQDRKTRETEITRLSAEIESKKQAVADAEKSLAEMEERKKVELQAIQTERDTLEAQKKTNAEELAQAQEKNTDEVKRLEGVKADLDKRQGALDEREEKMNELISSLEKINAELKTLQAAIFAGEKRLQQTVLETRELFKREGLADVFDKLQAEQKMRFLVSIVGRGSDKYVNQIVSELSKVNKGAKNHAKISSKPKNVNDSYVVDNQFVVESSVAEIRAFRDEANGYLEKENKAGAAASATSLFVVVRPIQKIRVGMKLTVKGSKSSGFEKRQSGVIMELNQIRAVEAKVYDIDQVNLNNPGNYVFSSDADGRKCDTVDLECLKVMKDKGLLQTNNVLMVRSADGQSTVQITNLEALTGVLQASIQQMNADYELYTKGMSILAIDYSVDNGFETKLDTESVKKVLGLFTGIGETRLPIVDSIELSYRIVMVDEISNTANPIDTWKYMNSGVIQNIQMFAADRQRNEIEIQLPIGNLKTSVFNFKDLGLSDYAIQTQKPVTNVEGAKVGTNVRGTNAAMAAANNKYKEDVKKERTAEYKNRLKTNMGMQQIYIETLKTK